MPRPDNPSPTNATNMQGLARLTPNQQPMEAAAEFDDPHDGWLIARLRAMPHRRLEDLLLDRRLRHLDVGGLIDHLERLEEEVVELRSRVSSSETQATGHVLFLPTPAGYAIIEADEAPPPVGQLLMLENRWFRVHRLGRSPFPRDRRPCLFLEAALDYP